MLSILPSELKLLLLLSCFWSNNKQNRRLIHASSYCLNVLMNSYCYCIHISIQHSVLRVYMHRAFESSTDVDQQPVSSSSQKYKGQEKRHRHELGSRVSAALRNRSRYAARNLRLFFIIDKIITAHYILR